MLRIVARAGLRLPAARLAKPAMGSALASAMAHAVISSLPTRNMDWDEDVEDDEEQDAVDQVHSGILAESPRAKRSRVRSMLAEEPGSGGHDAVDEGLKVGDSVSSQLFGGVAVVQQLGRSGTMMFGCAQVEVDLKDKIILK